MLRQLLRRAILDSCTNIKHKQKKWMHVQLLVQRCEVSCCALYDMHSTNHQPSHSNGTNNRKRANAAKSQGASLPQARWEPSVSSPRGDPSALVLERQDRSAKRAPSCMMQPDLGPEMGITARAPAPKLKLWSNGQAKLVFIQQSWASWVQVKKSQPVTR